MSTRGCNFQPQASTWLILLIFQQKQQPALSPQEAAFERLVMVIRQKTMVISPKTAIIAIKNRDKFSPENNSENCRDLRKTPGFCHYMPS